MRQFVPPGNSVATPPGQQIRKQIELGASRPGIPKSPRTQQLVDRLAGGFGQVPGLPKDILDDLLKRIRDNPDDVVESALARLRRMADKKRPMLSLGAEIITRMQAPGRARRFSHDVLMPASRFSLTSSEAWGRTNSILGFNALRATDQKSPGWTIGIGGGADAGLVGGVEGTAGLGGMRHRQAFFYLSGAVGAGAYVKVSGGLEVAFAPCLPPDYGGLSFGLDLGGAYYVGLTVGASIIPNAFGKVFFPRIFGEFVWDDLDSLSIGVPFGFGGEIAIIFGGTKVFLLRGTAQTEQPTPQPETVNAPTNLTGSSGERGDRSTISLTWLDNSNNEAGFHVERSSSGSDQFVRVTSVSANTTNFTEMEDLQQGRYDYRVQAYKGNILSPYSNVVSVEVKKRGRGGRRDGL